MALLVGRESIFLLEETMFYIRKTIKRGPVNVNISKSGIGISFGIKGLRIGIGPKGPYISVMNQRKSLKKKKPK